MPRLEPPCKTLVAVPVYNEQAHVANVIERIGRFARCVLVVDDGSTDYTPMLLAMQPVDVVRHKENLGYGRSIRDAFRWADTYGYRWLITMDCDEQHEPEMLPRFFDAIAADDADIVSGTRYIDGHSAVGGSGEDAADGGQETEDGRPPEDRRRINERITRTINDRLGLSITDAFCGFRAYRVGAIDHDAMDVDGYAVPLQQWVHAAAAGLRIKEVPVRLIYNDPNRTFGGKLDDPELRLKHYLEVFEREVERAADRLPAPGTPGSPGTPAASSAATTPTVRQAEAASSAAPSSSCTPCSA